MNSIVSKPYKNLPEFVEWSDLLNSVFSAERLPASKSRHLSPVVDVFETDEAYLLKTDLPGIDKDSLVVSVNDNFLIIEAKTKIFNATKENQRVIRSERYRGSYKHTFKLDNGVDANRIKASYNDGVLEVVLPKSKKSSRRVIEVVKH